jgi:hypothetical protein
VLILWPVVPAILDFRSAAYTVTFSFCCSTGIGYQKSYILVGDGI